MNLVDDDEPEAAMVGFQARTGPVICSTRRSEPNCFLEKAPPPFGSWRGNRIAYSVNFPLELSDRLDVHIHAQRYRPSLGAVAVDAIRACWESLADDLDPSGPDPRFPRQRTEVGRLPAGEPVVRRVLYVTEEEAAAIDAVRAALYDIELGQLHRACLERHLGVDGARPDSVEGG